MLSAATSKCLQIKEKVLKALERQLESNVYVPAIVYL